MEQMKLVYGFLEEIISAIMMLYKNTKAMIGSPNGDTYFFYIVARLLQEDTLAPYPFKLYLD